MLKLAETFVQFPVMSLRAGGALAHVLYPIINPDNLKIEAWVVEDKYEKKQLYLLAKDIRETMTIGFAINDHDVLSELSDLVRLKPLVELKYDVIGKHIVTENKQRLGKVSDYAVDADTMEIKKLYYSKGMVKSFVSGEASIDRSQVIETTPTYIMIDEATMKVRSPKLNPATSL
jgi:uncharacterized protein YrrD